jgi:tetratricopeptide (TPR) repeat protein
MNGLHRFDLLLVGFRDERARARTIAVVKRQRPGPCGPAPIDADTPLPFRLYAGLDQEQGLRLLAPLRDLGAQVRLVAAPADAEALPESGADRSGHGRFPLAGLALAALALYAAVRAGVLPLAGPIRPALPPSASRPPLQADAGGDATSSRLNAEAVGLNAAGDFAAAAERLRDALRREPERRVLRENLKIVLRNWAVDELNQGRLPAAIEIAEEGLRIDEDPGLLAVSGVAYSRLGEWTAARDDLERALALGTAEPATLFALGTTYRQLGNLEAAVEMLQKAKEAGATGGDFDAILEKLERELDAEWDFDELNGAHFRVGFEGGEDDDAARLVLAGLEDAYFFVGAKLGYFPPQRTQVVLYSGREFHDITQTPEWTGGIFDGRIKLPVRGLHENDPLLERTLRHEFAHVLVTLLTRNRVPVWLSEGVSIWAEEDEDGERSRWALQTISGRRLLNLAELERPFLHLPEAEVPLAYAQSYLAVRALLDQFGSDNLRRLLAALGDGAGIESAFQSVLATRFARFEADLVRRLTS